MLKKQSSVIICSIMSGCLHSGLRKDHLFNENISVGGRTCFDVALYQPTHEQQQPLKELLHETCNIFQDQRFSSLLAKLEWHTGRPAYDSRQSPIFDVNKKQIIPETVSDGQVKEAIMRKYKFHLLLNPTPRAKAQTDIENQVIVIKKSRLANLRSIDRAGLINSLAHEIMHLVPAASIPAPVNLPSYIKLVYAFEDGSKTGRDNMVSYQLGNLVECFYNTEKEFTGKSQEFKDGATLGCMLQYQTIFK